MNHRAVSNPRPYRRFDVSTLRLWEGAARERGIEPGKAADLVVAEGDPTEKLSDLSRVRHVFRDGVRVR